MKIIRHEQGSAAWLDWRKSGIGGSDAPCVMGVGFHTIDELWHIKKGLSDGPADNIAMARGRRYEPKARRWTEDYLSTELEPLCIEHDLIAWWKASLDGYGKNGNNIFACEIKVPGEKAHKDAVNGIVPEKYFPQVQHQLYTMNNEAEMFYVSYYIGTFKKPTPPDVRVIRIHPDLAYQKMLKEKEEAFIESLKLDVSPWRGPERPVIAVDPETLKVAHMYADVSRRKDALSKELETLKGIILEKVGRVSGDLGPLTLDVSHKKGSIRDEKLTALGIDPDSVRGEGTEEFRIRIKDKARITAKQSVRENTGPTNTR